MYYLLYLDMVKAKYTFALSALDGMFPYGTIPNIILCGYSAFTSVFARSCKVGDDKSLGAALVALYECVVRRSYVDIKSFLVGIL